MYADAIIFVIIAGVGVTPQAENCGDEQEEMLMEFRPCIDIHNGRVKQLIGGTVADSIDSARENYVSEKSAAWYAELFREKNLKNGHVVLLNSKESPYYESTKAQAMEALRAYPGGLQVGGGITAENAEEYLDAGASHVIVTSYVFRDGDISFENLNRLLEAVGKKKLVLDLSCRKKDGRYYIMTDRWQRYTKVALDEDILDLLASFCDEFLIHAVDVEGKICGIETDLVKILGRWKRIPITYAGGIRSLEDIRTIKEIGQDKIHVTIGSALDLYGGTMKFDDVIGYVSSENE